MNQIIIHYLDYRALFCDSRVWHRPESYVNMDDSDLSLCFDTLVSGRNVWVECHNLRRVVKYCLEHFMFVKAAGGWVRNRHNQELLILRNGRWDLPKGMVEQGETLVHAALREVSEETGLPVESLSLGRLITKTYHIYDLYGGWHLKQTTWFEMESDCVTDLIPQTEEDITQCIWCTPEERYIRLNQSYSTLKHLNRIIG